MSNRILVIDDDENMVKLLNLVLKTEYSVETVTSIAEAKQQLESSEFDLLLVDLKLSGESGFDFISYIREEKGLTWIPLMILSGMSKSEDRIKCFEMGADDYMVKPFNPVELKHRINRHIQKYNLIRS